MAEFSKQFHDCIKKEEELTTDFDYEEIFNDLNPNEAIGQICEGLGTIAVAKSEEGLMLLGIEVEENPEYIRWISLDSAIERAEKKGFLNFP